MYRVSSDPERHSGPKELRRGSLIRVGGRMPIAGLTD